MRIHYASMFHAEALCRKVASVTHAPLRLARSAAAAMAGYDDWNQLKDVTAEGGQRPSLPDEVCSTEVIQSRVLFQVARLASTLEMEEDDAAQAVARIRPTTAYYLPLNGPSSAADQLFPRQWVISAPPDNAAGRFIAEVGGKVQHDTLAELACGKEEGTAILDPSTGVRVFAAYTGEPQDGVQPGDPYAITVLRIVPLVQEQVLTHIEIRFLTFMCAEDIDEDGLEFAASSILSYLNQHGVHWQCSGEICGAAEGIGLSLHGTTTSDEERALVEQLDALLIDAEEEWQKIEDCSVMSTERLRRLPLAAFANQMEDLVEADDALQNMMSVSIGNVAAVHELVCSAMRQAPARLADYLCERGKAEYADFARAHDVGTPEGVCRFLECVQALEHARAIGIEVAVFIQNHFITSGESGAGNADLLLHEASDRQDDVERAFLEMNRRNADRAAKMDCPDMEKHYREMPPGRLADIVIAGQVAFLGNIVDA
jgi:hypothetical protein